MSHTIAAVLIQDGDRYLMVQEKLPKCYGQWNWPAGHVDEGETPEQAAVREAKEEVGLDVTISHEAGRWVDEGAGRTRILYATTEYSGALHIETSEILGAAWLTAEQIRALRDTMRVADWTADFIRS